MKGGVETIRAFKRLRATRQELFLTVVTPLHLLSHTDKELLESTPGVTLLDAVLGKDEMTELYLTHHVFLFPTLRDTFGLVLIEALSYGLPIIALDQYAVQEMVINRYNGFLLSNHPLTDYDRDTLAMKGTLYDAKVFYQTLFAAQKSGATKPIEDFIFASVEEYILQPELLLKHSRNSLGLYRNSFHEKIIREKIDSVFLASIS
jgi:hypothetical protein